MKNWQVVYESSYTNKEGSPFFMQRRSELMPKWIALKYLRIFDDAIYAVKQNGLFAGKMVHKNEV